MLPTQKLKHKKEPIFWRGKPRTCLRHAGKVIFPVWEGTRTTSRVMSRQRLQTHAHATTFWRFGHCSSAASTRRTISPRISGSMLDQPLFPFDDSSPAPATPSSPPTIAAPSAGSTSLNDLENLRERKTFLSDMAKDDDDDGSPS